MWLILHWHWLRKKTVSHKVKFFTVKWSVLFSVRVWMISYVKLFWGKEGKHASSSQGVSGHSRTTQPSLLGRQRVRLEAFKSWDSQIMRERKKAADGCLCAAVSVSGEGCSPNLSHWSNGWSESYPPSVRKRPSPSNTHGPSTMSRFH